MVVAGRVGRLGDEAACWMGEVAKGATAYAAAAGDDQGCERL